MMVNWRGIGWYLLITMGLTWAIEGVMIAQGVRFDGAPPIYAQLVVAGVMWVPALTAFIVRRWITREGFADAGLRFGSWRPYALILVAAPLLFGLIYGLTGLLGLGTPDWEMRAYVEMALAAGGDPSAIPANPTLLLLLVTTFITPWVNSIFAFGEEFGWTGYLMPRLLPLGRWKATLIYGMIWGLWHAPLILVGFNYPGHPYLGVLLMCGMAIALGMAQVALWLRTGSVILTAFLHGAFNSQAYGIWRVVYGDADPVLGGMGGLVGIAVMALIGAWLLARSPASRPGV